MLMAWEQKQEAIYCGCEHLIFVLQNFDPTQESKLHAMLHLNQFFQQISDL